MNNLQIFSNPEFGQVRTLTIEEEPWFVGKDVAVALGYENPQKAVRTHVDGEDRGVTEMDTPGGKQNICIINESGLYALIFGSKLESAKRFKRWVTHEVLPAIRKTGQYCIVADEPHEVEQRVLTTDDYLRAAAIVADCRNERLPYVLGFLERGGWEIPKIQEADTPAPRPPLPLLIKQALSATGMNERQLGDLLGVTYCSLSKYKNGRRTPRGDCYDYLVETLTNLIQSE